MPNNNKVCLIIKYVAPNNNKERLIIIKLPNNKICCA